MGCLRRRHYSAIALLRPWLDTASRQEMLDLVNTASNGDLRLRLEMAKLMMDCLSLYPKHLVGTPVIVEWRSQAGRIIPVDTTGVVTSCPNLDHIGLVLALQHEGKGLGGALYGAPGLVCTLAHHKETQRLSARWLEAKRRSMRSTFLFLGRM